MKTDLLLCLTGLIGGMINAIAGGGAILMFPALLAAGLPALIANATSSLVVWPGNITSAYTYRHQIRRIPHYYLWLLIPGLFGAIIGSLILIHTKSTTFEHLAPWLVMVAVLLLAAQSAIHHFLLKRTGKSLQHHPRRVILVIGVLIFPLAIYGGYFGVGYGIVMLAFLGFTNLKTIHHMNGLKNLSSATIALTSTLYFAHAGLINWHAGLVMAVGTIVGGILGARLALKAPVKLIHNLTVAFGLIIAVVLLVKVYH